MTVENFSAPMWWHSSTISKPQAAKVSGGCPRASRVWSMATTTSPEVSTVLPCTNDTLAPGRNCATRSAHCSRRGWRSTRTRTLRPSWLAIHSATVVLPYPVGRLISAPPRPRSSSSTRVAAAGWPSSSRRAPPNSPSPGARSPRPRSSRAGSHPASLAQNRGTTTPLPRRLNTANR